MKSFIFRLVGALVFLVLLLALILYARGFRLSLAKKNLVSTGILVASSYPDGAKIYLNGELKGATNSNLTLPPGNYFVEIKKESYIAWSKNLTVRGEVVVKADALLLPQNPSLSPITSLGVVKAHFSEKNESVVLVSRADDEIKDGVYLLETGKKTISLFKPLKLLALKSIFPADFDLAASQIRFSPDGKQLMIAEKQAAYLLSTGQENKELFDISKSKAIIEAAWDQEEAKTVEKILETFKQPLAQIASSSFQIISLSPDESKIFYRAKTDLTLPAIIKPALIGTNQTPEVRNLQKDRLYVYDKKEDKNFDLSKTINFPLFPADRHPGPRDTFNSILWHPDSTHLIVNEGQTIAVVDYDGENKRTVYAGPYEKDFLAATSDGKVLVLTNLNPSLNSLPDVYAVGIR